MNNKDLQTAQDLIKHTEEAQSNPPQQYDAAEDVKNALGSFLQKRLTKLKEDVAFEEEIKEVIRARISEADFNQLLRLLDLFQVNSNNGISNILSPFLQKIPALEQQTKTTAEEEAFSQAPKEMLQSIEELGRLVRGLQDAKSQETGNSIKEVLEKD